VTAAAAGIGRAIALTFAAEGAEVLATDIDEAGLAGLAGVAGLKTRRLDVTDPVGSADLFVGQPAFDVLVNAAGRVDGGTILECSDGVWDLAFDLNIRSMHRMTAATLPGMLAQGRGSIVNIGSVASSLKGVPNRCVYTKTKAAVIGLTKAVAVDFVGQGIRCNVICPGTVDTFARRPHSRRLPTRRPPTAILSHGSLWVALAPRRRSPTWRCTWPVMKPPSPAALST